jgi:acyl-CoA synthetase (AMP-forming)/AMP-acid ligase II
MFSAELELRNEIDKGGFEYLSKGIAAGSPVPIVVMKELIKTMNLNELTICYGMTETSPVSFMTSPNDALDKRTQTVGKIMPHTEAKIIKPPSRDNVLSGDLLRPLAVGTKGEIAVSGYLVQTKYYKDPDNSASAMIKDNKGKVWMLTGDEGFIDRDGYLTITGRIKDLIIRGGENIHSLEIENVLFTHKLVSQASVVGIFDEKYGESIVAYVITHSYTSLSSHDRDELVVELKKFVTDRLGKFFTPENIIFLDRFPKTASGKIRKVELREMAEDLIKQ